MGKINIIGSSSSIFQFEGRVWFEEPEIITGNRKAKVDEAIVELTGNTNMEKIKLKDK